MNTVIIACKILEKELLVTMDAVGCRAPVLWLEPGLHNWTDKLHREVQRLLDQCGEYDTVLLAMSLCGNAVVGLKTGDFSFVIPRCEDCITMLLGGDAIRRRWQDTYFLTEGWLESELSLRGEYEKTLKKYGEKRGKQIFSLMLNHYRHLAFVDTGCDDAALYDSVSAFAKELDLQPVRIEGTLAYLQALLTGEWTEDRFIVVPPESTVTAASCAPGKTAGSHCPRQ